MPTGGENGVAKDVSGTTVTTIQIQRVCSNGLLHRG